MHLSKDRKSKLFFHVDDLILVGNGQGFKEKFVRKFKGSMCQDPNTILGMKIKVKGDQIMLSQPNHIQRHLEELGLEEAKGSSTPLMRNLQLKPATNKENAQFKALNINYKSAIGLLNHIACYTRLDVSFAVLSLACFNLKPGITDWDKLKKTWKFLKSTQHYRLELRHLPQSNPLEAFLDATWADIHSTCKSQTGYLCAVFGSLVSWNS